MMSADNVVSSLKSDILGGHVDVQLVMSKRAGIERVERYLLRNMPANDLMNGNSKNEYDILFFTQHAQMTTELIRFGYSGPFAFEVPISTLIDCIDLYVAMAYKLLANRISLKLHLIFVEDLPDFELSHIKSSLAELVALGIELIFDGITTIEHIQLAEKILSFAHEVRLDLTQRDATLYTHLNHLFSKHAMKDKGVGIILSSSAELPDVYSTYQRTQGH